MAIRMTHPKHGTTFAVGAEVEWNEANGWKVDAGVESVVATKIEPVEFVAPHKAEIKSSPMKREFNKNTL